MKEAIGRFKALQAKQGALNHAMGVLNYDAETAMPPLGAQGMAKTMGILGEESYKLTVNDELRELIATLGAKLDELDPVTRREVEEQKEALEKMERVPMEEYTEFVMEQSAAAACWRKTKDDNDFATFLPHLEKLVAFMKRYAGYIKPELSTYNALLDEFERGLSTETLDVYFANVREALVPVIKAIGERGVQPDMTTFEGFFPIADQRRLSDEIVKVLTIDRNSCSLGEVQHPFTTYFNKHDVRLTTHYYENDVLSSMYSVAHEGGHSLYELHTGDELIGSPLASGASMGLHESQSRFFENIICRSEEFTAFFLPKMQEIFPAQLSGVTAAELYRAVNRSTPSLIRTEADELTYSLHIMVRYELEKQLFAGTLAPRDLPEAWNALYQEYLGVTVPDDKHGVLQDSHWSGGMFGYFPSYSIGSAYAAQMYANMEKELDVRALVARGELAPIIAWLTERIYRFGMLKKPNELVELACGGAFDPKYYTDYLTKKFTKLYQL